MSTRFRFQTNVFAFRPSAKTRLINVPESPIFTENGDIWKLLWKWWHRLLIPLDSIYNKNSESLTTNHYVKPKMAQSWGQERDCHGTWLLSRQFRPLHGHFGYQLQCFRGHNSTSFAFCCFKNLAAIKTAEFLLSQRICMSRTNVSHEVR